MDIPLSIVMTLLGLVGSFFSGLLGIGGAIINYPLLLFVPSSLGVANFTAQEVSTISMFQVLFASLAGVIAFRRNKQATKLVHKGLVSVMGPSILLGSVIGAYSSKFMQGDSINIIYGLLAIAAVVLLLIPSKGNDDEHKEELRYNRLVAVIAAFLVGIVSGIVGAGGAFILIPIMLTVLKIPTRTTIASSLAIVFISAIGGVTGKISADPIPLLPIIYTVIGSLIGASIGSRLSSKLNVRYLHYGLVILISLTTIKIWFSILY